MSICVRCFVSGKVQGVFYRASARHQAEQLGLTGYARNLPDGRVEVLACGEPDAVEQLRSWLTKGPADARCSNVSSEPAVSPGLSGFTTS